MDLQTGLKKCGIPQGDAPGQTADLAAKMEKYIKEIILFNGAYNLTNTSDHDELVVRHILDSLAGYSEIARLVTGRVLEVGEESPSLQPPRHSVPAGSSATPSPRVVDRGTVKNRAVRVDLGSFLFSPPKTPDEASPRVFAENSVSGGTPRPTPPLIGDIGSGGGLPGIPLAAAFPQVSFQLVERMEKRCSFLENCAAILGLKNVEVVCSEAERVPPENFDLITFRAFRPLDKKMTKTLLRMVKPGGHLVAYKAKMENIKEEMEAIKSLVPEYKVIPLSVPGLEDSERNLVIIRR